MSTTVIINNRDLLNWPRKMLEKIELLQTVSQIIIIDNNSTYPPLLEWYESKKKDYQIIRLNQNIGHKAPWHPEIFNLINNDFYVVSDPDLDISDIPLDTLRLMQRIIKKHPALEKIGLGLRIDCVIKDSPYYDRVNTHEKAFWKKPIVDGMFRLAPVDTTFALSNKFILKEYKITGGRMLNPYIARHIPWELTDNYDEEFKYYIEHASNSSSFKRFLKL